MGGHGGLNILPQKRWNVYNFDNREKVRKDEEAAAKEEQLKREQSKRRDTEFRLEQLRVARGLAPKKQAEEQTVEAVEGEPRSNHINLFEGIKIFDPIKGLESDASTEKEGNKRKKMKKEEVRVVGPEDEKYRLGYGIAGKGVKLPWYLEKRSDGDLESEEDAGLSRGVKEERKKSGKKTLEELREERLKREKWEKEREHALIMEKSRRDRGFSRRKLKESHGGVN
ncbi:hypothetical protein CFOL_v3_22005 [Cephalotus follicularis]|uniref:CBF1-interacting co-repressor CIR N-terminal domain-containing protein n=1 Tax=Cephalotus follicularis TaxID=3775 RepID=A0A1Q3CE81_CEPFO|nr:hypothetical protein CFOL_v3_22005 [Cephalotus follicularis]